MRVLLAITRGDSIGGAQLYVGSLAERLQQDQHEVLVVTGTPGNFSELLAERGIATIACSSLQRQLHPVKDARAMRELGRIIRAFNPDLVSAHSSKAGIVARLASFRQKVPCVFTAHGWSFADGVSEPGRTTWRWIERLAEPLAARIICVSNADRTLALACGFDPHRLVAIHNGIADSEIESRTAPVVNTPPRIVMIARFFAQKDHVTLLRAIRNIPACVLDLVGDGPLEQSMKDLAEQLGIADRVHFHGYRADCSSVLTNADIFVLSSHYEGFPLTTLEAMRAGLPTVVSDVGGSAEAVVHGVTGFVVPRNNVDMMRKYLRRLLDQPDLRLSMGAAARAAYLDAFTFDQMYSNTLAIYESAARTATPSLERVPSSGRHGVQHARVNRTMSIGNLRHVRRW